MGSYDEENDKEYARVKVRLATGISEERCRKINLGYCAPESIKFEDYQGRENQGILFVPYAGEMLYRLKENLNK